MLFRSRRILNFGGVTVACRKSDALSIFACFSQEHDVSTQKLALLPTDHLNHLRAICILPSRFQIPNRPPHYSIKNNHTSSSRQSHQQCYYHYFRNYSFPRPKSHIRTALTYWPSTSTNIRHTRSITHKLHTLDSHSTLFLSFPRSVSYILTPSDKPVSALVLLSQSTRLETISSAVP